MDFRIEHISKTYGAKTLFNEISLLVHDHDRIGLIGINGTGKSSLLNIISNKDSADSGDIISSNSYTVGHLVQDTVFSPSMTLSEVVFESETPQLIAVRNYELVMNKIEEQGMTESLQREYDKAEALMIKEDAWNIEVDVKTILTKLGLPDVSKTIGELSGGQQKRVGLAQVLIQSPDLLLLDEPTNHLDYDAIQWLESYLSQYRGAVIVVTHDRYFLDNVATRIVELSNSKLIEYKGNYAAYVEQKAEREENERNQDAKRRQLYKQELAWMRAGVQGRGTKQQARIQRFETLKESMSSSSQVEGIDMAMTTQRLGKKVLVLENACLAIDSKVLIDNLNLLVQAKDRIGIAGKNGVGKSTLLNVLAGRRSLDSGIYEIGETVKIAYYTQQNENMDVNLRVIQYLQEIAEEVQLEDGVTISVTEMLERFLFPRSMHGVQINSLSGGERRRLFLLRLLISQPNVLLLDEPTNDLDIDTLTILENYIQSFPGAVIAVSHDRYFLDKTMDKLLVFEGEGKISMHYGSMSDYLNEESKKGMPKKEKESFSTNSSKREEKKKKLSYHEKQEWETIEEDISKLEEKLEKLSSEMESGTSDFTLLQEKQAEIEEVEASLNEKMERWEYLSDLADN